MLIALEKFSKVAGSVGIKWREETLAGETVGDHATYVNTPDVKCLDTNMTKQTQRLQE